MQCFTATLTAQIGADVVAPRRAEPARFEGHVDELGVDAVPPLSRHDADSEAAPPEEPPLHEAAPVAALQRVL